MHKGSKKWFPSRLQIILGHIHCSFIHPTCTRFELNDISMDDQCNVLITAIYNKITSGWYYFLKLLQDFIGIIFNNRSFNLIRFYNNWKKKRTILNMFQQKHLQSIFHQYTDQILVTSTKQRKNDKQSLKRNSDNLLSYA